MKFSQPASKGNQISATGSRNLAATIGATTSQFIANSAPPGAAAATLRLRDLSSKAQNPRRRGRGALLVRPHGSRRTVYKPPQAPVASEPGWRAASMEQRPEEDHVQELETVPYLLYEPEDSGILWIKFNRPERLNAAVGGAERNGTLAKVGEYMRAGDDDPSVKVIVLTGVGRGFCAGVDVRGVDGFVAGDNYLGNAPAQEGPDQNRQRFYYGLTKLIKDLSFIRKPTIAMVNGPAAGFGMDMALQCDIRYGCENTQFIA